MFRIPVLYVIIKDAIIDRIEFTKHYYKGVAIMYATIVVWGEVGGIQKNYYIKVYGKLIDRVIKLNLGERITIGCRINIHNEVKDTKGVYATFIAHNFKKSRKK